MGLFEKILGRSEQKQGIATSGQSVDEGAVSHAGTPDDKVVRALLEDIGSTSRQILFGTDDAFTCFSDGRFLERAEALPPAIEKLRYQMKDNLSVDGIKKLIPKGPVQSGEMPQTIQHAGNRYELRSRNYTCAVDKVCYEYLKMRYPDAQIYCLGHTKPVVFLQDNIVRAVLMPLRK
jgi:hypothetical protein